MSRVRTFFASLALTSSLLGCAVPHAEAKSAKPVSVAPIKIKPAPQDLLRMQVRKALAERRKVTMERFLAYREGRVYPVNSKIPGAAHVWMDEFGNLCAAATIISQDWGRDRIAVGKRVAYLWCAEGILESRLNEAVGRALGDGVTARNWTTMQKLAAMTSESR